jgi:hypothetical protein
MNSGVRDLGDTYRETTRRTDLPAQDAEHDRRIAAIAPVVQAELSEAAT